MNKHLLLIKLSAVQACRHLHTKFYPVFYFKEPDEVRILHVNYNIIIFIIYQINKIKL